MEVMFPIANQKMILEPYSLPEVAHRVCRRPPIAKCEISEPVISKHLVLTSKLRKGIHMKTVGVRGSGSMAFTSTTFDTGGAKMVGSRHLSFL